MPTSKILPSSALRRENESCVGKIMTHVERELDLSALIYEPVASETRSDDAGVPGLSQGTPMLMASTSSRSRNRWLFSRALVLSKMLTNVVVR